MHKLEEIYQKNKRNLKHSKHAGRRLLQQDNMSKKFKKRRKPEITKVWKQDQKGLSKSRKRIAMQFIKNKILDFVKNSPDFYQEGIKTVRLHTHEFFIDEKEKTMNITFYDNKEKLYFLAKINKAYCFRKKYLKKHIHGIFVMSKEDYDSEEEGDFAQIF